MKKFVLALSLIAFVTPGYAQADFRVKEQGTKSQGNCVGVFSSQGTGNGAVVGGNGTMDGKPLPAAGGGSDQTTSPGSRAAEVRAARQMDCNTRK